MDHRIAFVFCNQIFYITVEEKIITVLQDDETIYMKRPVSKWEDSHDLFSQLVMAVYHALF